MNITQFIHYINKRKGLQIQSSYYANIDEWREYWEGFVPSFHEVIEAGLDGAKHKRILYSMRMPKKACEDWASLLLNDKTKINCADAKTAEWLYGDNQIGGMMKKLRFWTNANELVEKAFWSGTGAFVMSVDNITLQNGQIIPSPDARIEMDYLDASYILPITIRHKKIVDVAFASDVFVNGCACIYLQTHTLTDHGYEITHEYYVSKNEDSEGATYQPMALPKGMIAKLNTGSDIPWFAIFSPAIVKNIRGGNGLGVSVFAEAMDQAKQCDVAFNNYHRDIFLGGKKVFYNRKLIQQYLGADGEMHSVAPDDVQQQLFYQTGDGDDLDGNNKDVYEYNPDLRCDANSKAVQDALNYFSFKVGLGTYHYQFNAGTMATATQYNGSRQDLVANANKHQIRIEDALIQIVHAILWAGKYICGADIDPETEIGIDWDDSYITDAETRRAQQKDDVLAGLLPKYMYLMQYYGMGEEEARQAVAEAASENAGNSEPTVTFEE